MLPDHLSDVENALSRAFPSGGWVDLREVDGGSDGWGPDRTIRGEVIRALLLDAVDRAPGHSPAIRLRGARISGRLDLMGAAVEYALICEGCRFDDPVRFVEARTRTVRIVDCDLPAVNAARMHVEGILNLTGSRIADGLRLDRARITGEVCLRGATVRSRAGGVAVAADGLVVEGNVECCEGFTADGLVRLRGARLTGALDLGGAHLTAPGFAGSRDAGEVVPTPDDMALDARNLTVDGWVRARELRADGQLNLANMRVAGWMDFGGSRLRNPGGVVVGGGGISVGGGIWCNRGFTADGELRLIGARLDGNLTLTDTTLANPGGIALNLDRAALADLDGAGLTVNGGRISLVSTEISSRLHLRYARLDDGVDGTALVADGVSVGGVASLADSEVRGCVTFRTARIAGRLLLARATLRCTTVAARMSRAEIGSDLHANDLVAEGGLKLNGATIARYLSLEGARITTPGTPALEGRSLTAGEVVLGGSLEGTVDLRHARITVLRDEPGRWPPHLLLDGLTYEAVEPRLPAARRLDWLSRDPDGCPPQPYEQLAAHYTRIGEPAEARAVLYARERRQRDGKSVVGRSWGAVQDLTVGYGYRSFRAVWWFALLLVVGAVVYGAHRPEPLKPEEAPHFNPVVYPLDLLLPIVDLGQQNAFNPAGAYQWFSYFLIASGWVLATTIATGVARVLTRR